MNLLLIFRFKLPIWKPQSRPALEPLLLLEPQSPIVWKIWWDSRHYGSRNTLSAYSSLHHNHNSHLVVESRESPCQIGSSTRPGPSCFSLPLVSVSQLLLRCMNQEAVKDAWRLLEPYGRCLFLLYPTQSLRDKSIYAIIHLKNLTKGFHLLSQEIKWRKNLNPGSSYLNLRCITHTTKIPAHGLFRVKVLKS